MRRIVGLIVATMAASGLAQPVSPPSATAAPTTAVRAPAVKTYSYGRSGFHKYDVYRSSSSGRRPTVVIIHGGGWTAGDKRDRAQVTMARKFVAAGYTAISINYRLVKGGVTLDRSVADVSAALDHIRSRSAGLGVDKSRIAVVGSSAGGHLAMMLGTMGRGENRVRAVVASAGMPALQLQNEVRDFGRGKAGWLVSKARPQRGFSKESWYAKVDPYHNAGPGDAALLWLGATGDTYVHPELAWRLAGKLRSSGVSAKVVVADDRAHGLWSTAYAHRDSGWRQTLNWVDSRLKGRWVLSSKVSATLTVSRTGSTAVVQSSARTSDTPDSAPFSTPYRLSVAQRAGTTVGPYSTAARGRFSSGRNPHKTNWAGMAVTLRGIAAGDRVKLVVEGNGAPTTRIVTVR